MANTTAQSFIAGASPVSDGLGLLLIQIILILGISRLISIPLTYIRQPRVISEVIAGIVLGPTALGRWTWFSSTFFPTTSVNFLNVLANLGLVLFLLLMGLELDLNNVRSRARSSAAISLTGFCTTFLFSLGVSRVFYLYIPGNDGQNYGYFLLFIGVCMSVTAFPVLARILTDRKLLRTPVGVTVIAAAALDDALGWTFLALVVSLINASTPLTALWVFLVGLAFAIFMLTVMRLSVARLFRWFAGGNRDISPSMMVVAFVLCFAAAWFTDALGIHPIFGAFLTGLSLPRDNGFNVKLTERIEDLVTIVLLPLYFTYSGLKTNISTLNGMSLAYLLLVMVGVCLGKIGGCSTAARLTGLPLREALSVGVLMNTKGLVELIFLNIGLDAGIISQQTFAIMVLLAILTTMMTTPLVSWIYPPHVQTFFNDKNEIVESTEDMSKQSDYPLLLCLTQPTVVPSMMSLLTLIRPESPFANVFRRRSLSPRNDLKDLAVSTQQTPIHVARLILDSDRMSSTMIAAADPLSAAQFHDAALGVFATFAALRGIPIIPHILVSKPGQFAEDVGDAAYDNACGMVVVPFKPFTSIPTRARASSSHPMPPQSPATPSNRRISGPAWLSTFQPHSPGHHTSFALPYSAKETDTDSSKDEELSFTDDLALQLVRRLKSRVGVIVDRTNLDETTTGVWPGRKTGGELDVLAVFYGGPDDREALSIALRSASAGSCNLKILVIEDGTQDVSRERDESATGSEASKLAAASESSDGGVDGSADINVTVTQQVPSVSGPAVTALTDLFRKSSTASNRPSDGNMSYRKLSSGFAALAAKNNNQPTRASASRSRHEGQDEEILNRARALASNPLESADGSERPSRVTIVTVVLTPEYSDPIEPVLEQIKADDPSMVMLGRFGYGWNTALSHSDQMLSASERTYGYGNTIGSLGDLKDAEFASLGRMDSADPVLPVTPDVNPRSKQLRVDTKGKDGVSKARMSIIKEVLSPIGARIVLDNVGRCSIFTVRKVRIPRGGVTT
ncbi:hypothetical protein SmJEL517_g04726 [Synchytrium microbalum]|uniref:Cation/H+ exchanger transmembrane domain-containing protein n=1 Tax=Synchytrium microbalum TaxID=1806994 RepID=A0A507C3N6_9FUNG|nr:uncharacterized protein SmJEL517_g04726 [Synchytrium microbalum]TPX32133.1 hypothetical protein SmJEL517_g04726 [Synchytrium microbalum]